MAYMDMTIVLSENGIGPSGATALSSALEHLPQLQHLNLSCLMKFDSMIYLLLMHCVVNNVYVFAWHCYWMCCYIIIVLLFIYYYCCARYCSYVFAYNNFLSLLFVILLYLLLFVNLFLYDLLCCTCLVIVIPFIIYFHFHWLFRNLFYYFDIFC